MKRELVHFAIGSEYHTLHDMSLKIWAHGKSRGFRLLFLIHYWTSCDRSAGRSYHFQLNHSTYCNYKTLQLTDVQETWRNKDKQHFNTTASCSCHVCYREMSLQVIDTITARLTDAYEHKNVWDFIKLKPRKWPLFTCHFLWSMLKCHLKCICSILNLGMILFKALWCITYKSTCSSLQVNT